MKQKSCGFDDERKTLRRRKLEERDGLDADIREQKSLCIRNNFLSIAEVALARTIMLYLNFRSEVETLPLWEILYKKNIKVIVPLTVLEPPHLVAYQIDDPQQELQPGYCGILEPRKSIARIFDPAAIDIVVVPGAVFDAAGGRLGYGGGYYDRFLAQQAPQALRVALAFDMQIVERVPIMEHDERMHYLVTENRNRKI